jgi:hypothetical protein
VGLSLAFDESVFLTGKEVRPEHRLLKLFDLGTEAVGATAHATVCGPAQVLADAVRAKADAIHLGRGVGCAGAAASPCISKTAAARRRRVDRR